MAQPKTDTTYNNYRSRRSVAKLGLQAHQKICSARRTSAKDQRPREPVIELIARVLEQKQVQENMDDAKQIKADHERSSKARAAAKQRPQQKRVERNVKGSEQHIPLFVVGQAREQGEHLPLVAANRVHLVRQQAAERKKEE